MDDKLQKLCDWLIDQIEMEKANAKLYKDDKDESIYYICKGRQSVYERTLRKVRKEIIG